MTVRFSNQLVADLIQPFWAAWQGGEFMTDASAVAGTHRQRGLAWVRPRRWRALLGRPSPSTVASGEYFVGNRLSSRHLPREPACQAGAPFDPR